MQEYSLLDSLSPKLVLAPRDASHPFISGLVVSVINARTSQLSDRAFRLYCYFRNELTNPNYYYFTVGGKFGIDKVPLNCSPNPARDAVEELRALGYLVYKMEYKKNIPIHRIVRFYEDPSMNPDFMGDVHGQL